MNEYCPGVRRVCVLPEKCCLSGTICCVPTSYTLTRDHPHKRLIIEHDIRFSVINLWYFWFAVVFFVTTCSGICAFWRRQRRLLLMAAERSATNQPQSCRVELSPGMSRRQLGRRHQRTRRELGSRQVEPRMTYLDFVLTPGCLERNETIECAPPLYADVMAGKDVMCPTDDIPPSYAEASRQLSTAAADEDDVINITDSRNAESADNLDLLSAPRYHEQYAASISSPQP